MLHNTNRVKAVACVMIVSILISFLSPIGGRTVNAAGLLVMDYAELQMRMSEDVEDTVVLGADIAGSTQLDVTNNKTLDLNGHNLTIIIPNTDPSLVGIGELSSGILLDTGSMLTIRDSNSGSNKLIVKNMEELWAKSNLIMGTNAAINTGGGNVIIESGIVEATGGLFGAGIGGGINKAGTVTITGGIVTAIGGERGAGIGGGSGGAGTVTITGGIVIATGGYNGAGIGGGSGGAGTVTITGGSISAKGGNFSHADIGGHNLGINTVYIDGGSVTGSFNAGFPRNSGDFPLYLLEITVPAGVDNQSDLTVNMSTPSIAYTAPVRHNGNKSYLWLPEGEAIVTYIKNGMNYTKNITIEENNTNHVLLEPIPPTNGTSSDGSSSISVNVGPYINAINLSGWKDIEAYLLAGNYSASKQITIHMGSDTIVPGSVLEALRGSELRITFVMSGGIEWTIGGEDFNQAGEPEGVVGDINLKVTKNSGKIPRDILTQLEQHHGMVPLQLSLAHSGSFGFGATLRMRIDEKEAGRIGNVYYYNEATGELSLQAFGRCETNGYIELLFTHASDYVLVLDDGELLQTEMNRIRVTPIKKTLYVGGTKDKNANIKLTYPDSLSSQQRYRGNEQTITYHSSKKKVVSVTASGKITALKQGNTTVTTKITINGVSVSIPSAITVKKASIKLIKRTGSLKKGEKYTFQAKGYGIDSAKISWSTTAPSILKINKKTGRVTAVSTGTAYVIAKQGKVLVKYKVIVKA